MAEDGERELHVAVAGPHMLPAVLGRRRRPARYNMWSRRGRPL